MLANNIKEIYNNLLECAACLIFIIDPVTCFFSRVNKSVENGMEEKNYAQDSKRSINGIYKRNFSGRDPYVFDL